VAREAQEGKGVADDGRDTVRCFFAVSLDEAAREAAAALLRELRRRDERGSVRWVRPEALHVTLRFLGPVERARLSDLAASVAAEAAVVAPFALRLADVHAFPTPRRPRVVALGLEPEEALREAAEAVERGVVAAGFAPEGRVYRGHLTLGRLRGRRAPRLEGVSVPGHEPFPVRETVLFQSELGPGGSRYTPLERVPFRGDS
jgi:2'-5' RNA ligase